MNKQDSGHFPVSIVAFYDGDKAPEVNAREGFRHSKIGFKLTKKMKDAGETKRENFLALVPILAVDDFNTVSGVKFLQDLVDAKQDEFAGRIADGELSYFAIFTPEGIIAEHNDKTRESNGRRFTKETISGYFAENLAATVIRLALVKTANAKQETLENIAKGYGEMFSKLGATSAGNLPTLTQVKLMQRVILESELADDFTEWMGAKLETLFNNYTQEATEIENALG